MHISEAGLKFIAGFEGKVLNDRGGHIEYRDAVGKRTIGYGHLILGTAPFLPPPAKGYLTEVEALAFLRADCEKAIDAIKTSIKVPLMQHQVDALASWFFNLGLNMATFTSNLVKLINSPIYWEAATEGRRWPNTAIFEEFSMWTKAGGKVLPGLVRRRDAEAALWNYGEYNLEA